jgi:hypothetical protein
MTATLTRPSRSYSPTGRLGTVLTKAGRIKHQIALLEAQLSALKPTILEHMNRMNLDTIDTGSVEIQRKRRHKWTYTPECQREILALDQLMSFEKKQGLAVDNPTVYISIQVLGGSTK